MHRALYGPSNSETLRVQHEIALALREAKRYGEFERELRDILATAGKKAQTSSPFMLEVSSDLGYALFQLGRYDEAIAVLRPTLARQRALFGDVHRATLYTIRSLGSALRDRGNIDEAEVYYRDALRISRALYGENHTETESALVVLALALQRKNSLAEAESLSREAFSVATKVHGEDYPMIWGHYGNMGTIRLDRGDVDDAEHWLRQGLALSRKLNRRHPDQGYILNRLAYIAVSRNAPDADRLYHDAVSFDNTRPAGSVDYVTDGIHFLAMAQQLRGDTNDAARTYRRALRIYEKQLPVDHPYRVAALKGLAEVTK
jgi:tetratricopeptide (TPR) repeat protein